MKAKFMKQHKISIDVSESEDDWGDKCWIVNGINYSSKELALMAARELVNAEFQGRSKKFKKETR